MSDENIRASASAGMTMTLKRGTRKSMPKVRTGCLTCKQRRIKCDEAKPECRNCSRTGRHCEGYPDLPTPPAAGAGASHSQELQVHNQTSTSTSTPIKVYSLPFKVPGSQADRQLLHFYCVEAAGGLSSFSDTTLWTNLILQRSHDQPVIRHSLVTLSALYRDYLVAGHELRAEASKTAMQRIARCHRQLRLHLQSPNASIDTALICSILFFAFETLMGDSGSATMHLDNGLNLLKQCQTNSTNDLLPYISAIFARLDIHASTFDDERIPMLSLVSPDEVSGVSHVVPDHLSTLDEAETVLTKFQNWLMHQIIAHVSHKHDAFDIFPKDLLHERMVLFQQFERFFFAIQVLFECMPQLTHRALLLRIQAKMYHAILLENIPHDPAGPFREQSPDDSWQEALGDIQTFLSLDSDKQRHFTLSSQLTAILYFLCLKTKNNQSRELAFSLLQHSNLPAKDGLWESSKAASIIQILIDQRTERHRLQSLEWSSEEVYQQREGGVEGVLRDMQVVDQPF